MLKTFFTNLLILFFSDRYRKETIFFSWLIQPFPVPFISRHQRPYELAQGLWDIFHETSRYFTIKKCCLKTIYINALVKWTQNPTTFPPAPTHTHSPASHTHTLTHSLTHSLTHTLTQISRPLDLSTSRSLDLSTPLSTSRPLLPYFFLSFFSPIFSLSW